MLFERDPRCTLKQLCDWAYEERGVTINQSEMCRLLKGYGLKRRRNHRCIPRSVTSVLRVEGLAETAGRGRCRE